MTLWDILLQALAFGALAVSAAVLAWWAWADWRTERDWQRAERKRQGGGG